MPRPPITKFQIRTLLDSLRDWDPDVDELGNFRKVLLRYATEQGQSFGEDTSDLSLVEYARHSSSWQS